jgi:hypothetical protein
MKAMRYLATVCGVLCGLTISAFAAEQPIGTVVGIPAFDLDNFVRANTTPPSGEPANTVTVLNNSPEFATPTFTVAVTQSSTGQPATTIYLPSYGSDSIPKIYQQINDRDILSKVSKLGSGITSILKVKVSQLSTGSYEPGQTRFLLVPLDALEAILDVNPDGTLARVHQQRTHVGAGNLAVELLAVTGTSSLLIPERMYGVSLARTIAGMNANVSLRSVAVTDRGAVATIEVQ